LDTFSRRVVDWSIDSSQTAALVTHALSMTIANRDLQAGGDCSLRPRRAAHLVALTDRAKRSGLVPSIVSIGDCCDNAMIEPFWDRMQTELLNRKRWKTRIELANAIFDYLENFHNRQRRHSALGMRTPIEFELLHQPAQPVA
jgi:transposase InsO family protein